MHDPVRVRAFPCAAQQTPRDEEMPRAARAFAAAAARISAVLLAAAMLCAASAVREFDVGILQRRVEGGTSTLRVKRGDTVLLRWRTDETVSLHLHGYDVRASVSPGSTGTMRVEAGVAGRFPITAHEFGTAAGGDAHPKKRRETTLLYLEVLPE